MSETRSELLDELRRCDILQPRLISGQLKIEEVAA